MNIIAKLLCSLTILTSFLVPARAASPEYINYQGLLNGANGLPLPTGNYPMEFNIYDQANLGGKVWGPFLFDGGAGNGHGPLVPVANGRFNVIIGPMDTNSAAIQTAFASANRFVEIKVNNGSPILPRQQFLSTPYAFKASNADQAALVTDANVAYRNTANTFTGNQTVNGNAIVNGGATVTGNATVSGNVTATGNVTAGGKGVAVGEENLRIVRGIVRGNTSAGLNEGAGYTVVNFLAGQQQPETTVTFAQAFTDLPSVALTLENASEAWHISVISVSTTSFNVRMWRSDSVRHNTAFHFIAIGPR